MRPLRLPDRVQLRACARAARLAAWTGAAALLLWGCADPAGIAPKAQALTADRVGLAAFGGPSDPAIAADWWRGFGDPVLDALVERSLSDNPNLKVVAARLARAAAGVAGAQSTDGVHVDGAADVTRQRLSANTYFPPPLGGSTVTMGNVQIGASWEADVFGRNRSAIEAAVGMQRAAEADLQAARTVLASEVARSYVQLSRLFAQRDVAQRALAQREEILALIRQRVQGGLDTNVELRQGEGALPDARLQIEQIDEQIGQARRALAALGAQPPSALDGLAPGALHPLGLPPRVPADLLGRRADVAAARWRIEAATSDMASARAEFYPDVNLVAFVGLSSIGLDKLFSSGSREYGVGPAIRLPIFDNGYLRARLGGKAADVDGAIASYNAAVVEAARQAADQIGALQSIERQQLQQTSAQDRAEQAYALATQRYRAGLGSYLTVLNVEAALLSQRRLAADLRARLLDAQIALARALGGGYAAPATGA